MCLNGGWTGSANPLCCLHTGQQETQVDEQSFIPHSADSYRTVMAVLQEVFNGAGVIYDSLHFAREGWKLGKTPHLDEGLQRQHRIPPSFAVASVRHQAENPVSS